MKLKLIVAMLTFTVSLLSLPAASAESSLNGAGSTFALNFVDKCRVLYVQQTGNLINYSANGSGAGRNFLTNNLVDFAVSDAPYSKSDNQPSKEILYVPLVAGPIAIVYNLPDYKTRLKLNKQTLAKIFAGQITMWNDPEIQKINVGKLPNLKITVVYRQDGSGTSEVFTSYLNSVAPSIWTKKGNKDFRSAFPGTMNPYFQAVSGSTQIAATQKMFKGSIGYNEVSYARDLKTAGIENEAGKFTYPTPSAAANFLSQISFNENGSGVINYKNKSPYSYNISTFAYAIAYKESGDKAKDIRDFLTFALAKCNNVDGYAPITANALKVAKLQIAKIK